MPNSPTISSYILLIKFFSKLDINKKDKNSILSLLMLSISFAKLIAVFSDFSSTFFISSVSVVIFCVAMAKSLMLIGVGRFFFPSNNLKIVPFKFLSSSHLQPSFSAHLSKICLLFSVSYEGFFIFSFFSNSLMVSV